MNYVEFVAGEETYKLRLDTKSVILLERTLKQNPLSIFGLNGKELPTVATMTAVLHASLQPYHAGTSPDEAYSIFDAWLEDGHIITDFLQVILEIYRTGGLIKKEAKEKN